jgi:hypothetical protein
MDGRARISRRFALDWKRMKSKVTDAAHLLAAEGPHVIDRYWLRPVRRRTEELLIDFEPGDP